MPPVIRNVRASPPTESIAAFDDVAATWFRLALDSARGARSALHLVSTHTCLIGGPVATNRALSAPAPYDELSHPPANQVARSR